MSLSDGRGPVQVSVLPVRDANAAYAASVTTRLREAGFRVDSDEAAEPLGARVRRAKLDKLPYVLVVGEKEETDGMVAVRSRKGDEGAAPLETFVKRIKGEVTERSL